MDLEKFRQQIKKHEVKGEQVQDIINDKDNVKITAIFKSFSTWVKEGGVNKKKDIGGEVPQIVLIESKTKKDKNDEFIKFPGSLMFKAQIHTINDSEGKSRFNDKKGGWDLCAKVTFTKDAKEYLLNNYKEYYSFEERVGKIGKYINEDGELAKNVWVTIYPKSVVDFQTNGGDKSTFRKRDGNNNPLVKIGTILRLDIVEPRVRVVLKNNDLVGYTTYDVKYINISDLNDTSKPLSEILHKLESKDSSALGPVTDLADTENPIRVDYNPYFYIKNEYATEDPSLKVGIFRKLMDIKDPGKDLVKSVGDKTALKRVWRFHQFQHYTDSGKDEFYMVKCLGNKPDIAKKFGILNEESYREIMMANPDIWCHLYCKLWKKATIEAEGNTIENMAKEPENFKGYYTFGVEEVVPDYYRWLKIGAIPISKDRVCSEFEEETFEDTKRNKVTITLEAEKNQIIVNPLHYDGKDSPIINFGNREEFAISGNIYPIIQRSTFYVVSDYKLSPDELEGVLGSPSDGDAFFDSLLKEEKIQHYQIFAIQDLTQNEDTEEDRKASAKKKTAKKPAPKKRGRKKK